MSLERCPVCEGKCACPHCGGTGRDPKPQSSKEHNCPVCHGRKTCPTCRGTGSYEVKHK